MMIKITCPALYMLVVFAILTGCATPITTPPQGDKAEIKKEERKQRIMSLKRYLKEEDRVYDIAYPIFVANAELCPETYPSTGVIFWNTYSVEREYRDAANIYFGLGDVLQVRSVIKGSPGEKAGIKSGDKLISVNKDEISSGKNAYPNLIKLGKKIKRQNIELTLNRDGKEITKHVSRDLSCGYGLRYQRNDSVINAFADGKEVIITRGMYRFAENDDELALVIAHELAHNTMGHIDKKNTNALHVGLIGFATEALIIAAGGTSDGSLTKAAINAGVGAYSVEFEQEADYVGMYFLARSGYKMDGAANFWRRMASENNDAGIGKDTTHPSNPKRFMAMDKTREEIQKIKLSGGELIPKIKKK